MFRIACHVLGDTELNPVTFSGVKGNSIHSSHGQAYNVPSKLLPDDGSVVLVSSELSGIFPENLTIGTIRSLDNTGEKYISAAVDLDDDVLSKLYEVTVLVPEE
jgi:cell shape-determining protein MreC